MVQRLCLTFFLFSSTSSLPLFFHPPVFHFIFIFCLLRCSVLDRLVLLGSHVALCSGSGDQPTQHKCVFCCASLCGAMHKLAASLMWINGRCGESVERAPADTCEADPVIENGSAAPAVAYHEKLAFAVIHAARAPAGTYAAPALLIDNMAPAPAVTFWASVRYWTPDYNGCTGTTK